MIPQKNISNLSVKLMPIQEKTIEQDYIISWVLAGLTYTKLNDWILFKGGTALKKLYINDYRFSEDLDFTLVEKEITEEAIHHELEIMCAEIKKRANISLRIKQDKETHVNTLNYYINYTGPLNASIDKGSIKLDITINEMLIYKASKKSLLREYEEYYDLPYDQKISAYDIREIFLEKLCCLLDPKRKQPRDVYDLWSLLDSELVEADMLIEDFKKKSEFKALNWKDLKNTINNKNGIYKSLWDKTLGHQMSKLPEFEGIYRHLNRLLKKDKYFD